jgi:transposase-like protein
MPEPKTLQQAITYFADPNNSLDFLALRRWPDGVICPTCGSKEVRFLATRRLWECKVKHPKKQFSIKVGTIFEDSPISLDKWLTATWMIANCKNGISSYEIHRALGVTQKTAWFMLHRIRVALRSGSLQKLGGGPNSGGGVEVDETWVGGKVSNMHSRKRNRLVREAGSANNQNKTIVMGLLDRAQREIRTVIVPTASRITLQAQVLKHVHYGSNVYTDQSSAYTALANKYVHEFVNHMESYVRGQVHTNGLENFWSLFKRHLRGTYVAIEPCHMARYLDEQVFRYNNRGTRKEPKTDADRFDLALRNIVGKRITYKELTGKEGETAAF